MELVASEPKKVEEWEGLSTCSSCGQVYAGRETKCRKIVAKAKERDWWSWRDIKDYPNYRYDPMKHQFGYMECESRVDWNKQIEYNYYHGFLNFQSDIQNITYSKYDFQIYSQHLTPEAKDLVLQSLPDRIKYLESMTRTMTEAINEIANKLNDAGNSLRF